MRFTEREASQFGLRLNAASLELGGTRMIWRENLPRVVEAFGSRDWVGGFDHPSSDPRGPAERAMVLWLAAEILND